MEHDTFVDDLLFATFHELSALEERDEVIILLNKAHLEPRKWASNNPHLTKESDSSNHGLAWNPSSFNEGIRVFGITWDRLLKRSIFCQAHPSPKRL